jgi:hypothetical protein
VSTEPANDDASVSSMDSSCSGSSGNSSSTSSSGRSSSSESSKQLLEKNVADDGNTIGVDGVTTATVAIANVIAAVSAAPLPINESMVPELLTVNHLIMLPLLRRITMLMMCTWK